MPPVRRSCLSVPGHAARMHVKALGLDADEVVFDLEDAVAPAAKQQARDTIRETLADRAWAGRVVAVRVNAGDSAEYPADLELCATLATEARLSVVLPKVESAEQIVAARGWLRRSGAERPLQALLETAAGLGAAHEIAAAGAGLEALILGYADLAAALGRRGAELVAELWLVQQETVLGAARAAGLQAIDGPLVRLGDATELRTSARLARDLGFDGKWAIHPEQLATINTLFAAGAGEVARAQAVAAALDAAAASGDAAVRAGGGMVDEAMRRHSERLLALPRRPAPPPRTGTPVAAPFYEDLSVGDVFGAPGVTLDEGQAALHRAIAGHRLRLCLDAPLARAVCGGSRVLAHPMLVCDVAIGQSTEPSGRVLGNLFYRGLTVRPVPLGTTLRTRTEIVARRRAKPAAGRPPRGLVVLHVRTTDENGDVVLELWRCPLLPARAEPEGDEPGDDLGKVGHLLEDDDLHAVAPGGWDLSPLREDPLGPSFAALQEGTRWAVEARESVTAAPELARLSLNLATAHTDGLDGPGGRRLVYGGHAIGIAAAHLSRALPDLATILAWRSCDHLAPVFEGDRLRTELEVERLLPLADGGLVEIRAIVSADRGADDDPEPVLDWRLVGLLP